MDNEGVYDLFASKKTGVFTGFKSGMFFFASFLLQCETNSLFLVFKKLV